MKISCDKFYDHSNPHANLLLYSVIVIVSFPVRIYDVLTECSAPRLTVVDACKMEKNRYALFEQMSNALAVFVNIMQTLIATRPNYFFLHPPPPTELQNIAGNIKNKMLRTGHYLSSVEGGGVGRRILIPKWPPPSKSSDPFLPPPPSHSKAINDYYQNLTEK